MYVLYVLYMATWAEVARANSAVAVALRDGVLKKGKCRDCGSAEVEAHHPDYSKPLEVIWFCRKHHRQEHAKLGTPLVEKWTVLNIRGVPNELVRTAKMTAALLDISLKDLVIDAVDQYCLQKKDHEFVSRLSDAGSPTKAQINAAVDPSSDGRAARGCKTPEAQSLRGGIAPGAQRVADEVSALAAEERERIRLYREENGYPPLPGDEAQSFDGAPRIRIGSGLNGGEIIVRDTGPDQEYVRQVHEEIAIRKAQNKAVCPRCYGKEFLNPDGSPINAFEGCDSDPTIPCPDCNPYGCPDCREAMKHAYSDKTTPGFFYDRCEKHRRLPVDDPDIRNAVGVVTVEEMPVEEAKRRFPGLSGTPINIEPFQPAPGGSGILYEPDVPPPASIEDAVDLRQETQRMATTLSKEPTDETRTNESNQKTGTNKESDQTRWIQPGNTRGSKTSSGLLGSSRTGNDSKRTRGANSKSDSETAQAAARKSKHANLRNERRNPQNSIDGSVQAPGKLRSSIAIAKKIPGVKTAAEVPPPARDPRKPCPSCGALHGMHQKGCKERK